LEGSSQPPTAYYTKDYGGFIADKQVGTPGAPIPIPARKNYVSLTWLVHKV